MTTTETMRPQTPGAAGGRGIPKLRLLHMPGAPAAARAAAGRLFTLPVGATLIGRELDEEEGILLATDRRASREHVRVEVSAKDLGVRVVDLGSKNGTWVNTQRLTASTPVPLSDGDILRVGDSFFLLRHGPAKPPDSDVPELIGVSPAMGELRHRIARLAPDPVTVLILGETGTGKEVVSLALHRLSGRPGTRIAVNCTAIPENLAESQFFGHTANAFTGAKLHLGYFRAAHRGSLFLDEVGDIPPALQAKLLRALEDRAVLPVGATEPVACDVRLLAATNRDLQRAIAAGQFREDLYARLADVILNLPPLRARREDILLLLHHASPQGIPELPSDVVELLLHYTWPRNVRELMKIADHLRLFGVDDALRARLKEAPAAPIERAAAEPAASAISDADEPARPHRVRAPDKEQLIALLKKHGGVAEYVARELGCSRRQVGRWIETYELDREQFREK